MSEDDHDEIFEMTRAKRSDEYVASAGNARTFAEELAINPCYSFSFRQKEMLEYLVGEHGFAKNIRFDNIDDTIHATFDGLGDVVIDYNGTVID